MSPPSTTAAPTLADLPTEVLIALLKWVRPRDVLQVACSSRRFSGIIDEPYLWIQLASRRFEKSVLPDACDNVKALKDIYKDLCRMSLNTERSKLTNELAKPYVLAKDLSIAWLNGVFWTLEDGIEDSVSPHVAVMHSVCWFDVQASLKSVPAGNYIPYFRVRLNDSRHLDRIEVGCGVEVEDPSLPEGQLVASSTKTLWSFFKEDPPRYVWTRISLPEIKVSTEREFSKVKFWMTDHSTEWKFGDLVIDTFGLESIDSLSLTSMGGGQDSREEDSTSLPQRLWSSFKGIKEYVGL
ncbi:hypothetical protein HDU67_005779 [Dinochytrium kinnereticum]|nr:hypothetical protein HDU67_005779 [Dinochytrium kinnereticum]